MPLAVRCNLVVAPNFFTLMRTKNTCRVYYMVVLTNFPHWDYPNGDQVHKQERDNYIGGCKQDTERIKMDIYTHKGMSVIPKTKRIHNLNIIKR